MLVEHRRRMFEDMAAVGDQHHQPVDRCAKAPTDMRTQVQKVLQAASSADQALLAATDELIDELDRLMIEEGFDPNG